MDTKEFEKTLESNKHVAVGITTVEVTIIGDAYHITDLSTGLESYPGSSKSYHMRFSPKVDFLKVDRSNLENLKPYQKTIANDFGDITMKLVNVRNLLADKEFIANISEEELISFKKYRELLEAGGYVISELLSKFNK